MHDNMQTKTAVSIKMMASMCGLSYQRFAQLRRSGVFPQPLYDVQSKRPFYDEEQQKVCLLVRKRNTGINGQTIIFYSQRRAPNAPKRRKRKTTQSNQHATLVDSIKSLGMTDVTPQQVNGAVQELYPSGTPDMDQSEIVRAVFVHLMRKNSTR